MSKVKHSIPLRGILNDESIRSHMNNVAIPSFGTAVGQTLLTIIVVAPLFAVIWWRPCKRYGATMRSSFERDY